mgnify:CR=1 FL=1
MDNKYIGLILPAITFIYSLIALLSFAIFDGATTGEIVVSMLTTFLGTNLPTLILLGIYFLCRENIRRKRQLDKMNKQDLAKQPINNDPPHSGGIIIAECQKSG